MSTDEGNIRISVLDRLIDREPDVSYEPVQYRMLDMRKVRALVIHDLENLLNTRRIAEAPPQELTELQRSVYVYGLKDFTATSTKNLTTRKQLRQEIEQTIALFEPRLRNVRVMLEGDQKAHSLQFKISAMLVLEPEREPIQFDTFFDVNRGQYSIKI